MTHALSLTTRMAFVIKQRVCAFALMIAELLFSFYLVLLWRVIME